MAAIPPITQAHSQRAPPEFRDRNTAGDFAPKVKGALRREPEHSFGRFARNKMSVVFTSDEILIYASSNGDRWYLLRDDADPGRLRVRQQPNLASGGRATTVEVDEFLAQSHGPQHEGLQRHLQQLGFLPLS